MDSKSLMKGKRKNTFIQQLIVHIYFFSHDMKVRHRPILDSGHRQTERHV